MFIKRIEAYINTYNELIKFVGTQGLTNELLCKSIVDSKLQRLIESFVGTQGYQFELEYRANEGKVYYIVTRKGDVVEVLIEYEILFMSGLADIYESLFKQLEDEKKDSSTDNKGNN